MTVERLWRLKDIAESFDVSYSTLWRWAQSGRMQAVKLPGGALRIKDSEIQRILGEAQKEVVTV